MFRRRTAVVLVSLVASNAFAQTNPLWHEEKTKNYLPHMSWPEVRDLLTRSDIVTLPVARSNRQGAADDADAAARLDTDASRRRSRRSGGHPDLPRRRIEAEGNG